MFWNTMAKGLMQEAWTDVGHEGGVGISPLELRKDSKSQIWQVDIQLAKSCWEMGLLWHLQFTNIARKVLNT